MDTHASDCATHDAPALPAGECDCKVPTESDRLEAVRLMMVENKAAAAASAFPFRAQSRWTENGYVPLTCAKTGVALMHEDEIVVDQQTDECFLRSALGLPPRTKDDSGEKELPF